MGKTTDWAWTSRAASVSYAEPHLTRPGSSGVEQRIENPRVGGSIPPPGTIKNKTLQG